MGALVLDLLLFIILLMMVPIGFFRGGLRELCVSGGLMLGILLAGEWAGRWSALPKKMFEISNGAAEFLMGIVIAFGVTALFGYGGSAAFSYQPGPGGRLYGAYLALINGMVAAGFLINLYLRTVAPGLDDEPITSGILASALSRGFGWVLLVATIGVGFATVFGMFVRERPDPAQAYPSVTQQLYQPPSDTRPYRPQEEPSPRVQSGPVQITDVPNLKDIDSPVRADPTTYGSGWRQTWPDSKPDPRSSPERRAAVDRPGASTDSGKPTSSAKRVLADWVKDQDSE